MRIEFARALRTPFLRLHKLALKFGLQILPNHFYSSVSDMNKLKDSQKDWAKPSLLPGIKINLQQQADNLVNICSRFQKEIVGNKIYHEACSKNLGLGFGYIDAHILHSVIRFYKPKRIIEVGSGVSTYCILKAVELNGTKTKIVCVEPHPNKEFKKIKQIKLFEEEVQKIPLDTFLELKKGDFLFIDSSHTVKPASDVNFLILEVLPRLKSGVIVHFHDIYFPYDYQRDLLTNYFQRCETSLLRAFLINNKQVEILFSLSLLHYQNNRCIKQLIPEYNPQKDVNGLTYGLYKPFEDSSEHFPSSIYFQIQ